MQDCLFCKIAVGEMPSSKVYEDDAAMAFMDINPWSRGHTLVIPKEHAATIFELSEEGGGAMIKAVLKVAPAVKAAVQAEGMNLLQSNGRVAWQQVDHVHIHLVPRWANDGLRAPAKPQPGDMDEIGRLAEAIKRAL
ncbi:MAG: HIT family protein [Actinomycetota bacterium]